MKILLLSPVAILDEAGGDVTYTETLVADPPPGVEYETYDHALARGALRERGVGRTVKAVMKAKHRSRFAALTALAREGALTGISKTVLLMRSRRWLYWEPFRFFQVKRGEFDLIHTHIFSARFDNLDCPLVVSCGGPLRHLYLDARNYSMRRVNALDRIDLLLGRLLGVNVSDKYLPQAQRLMVYSQGARQEMIDQKILPADRIDVIPIFQASPALPPVPKRPPFRVGFVARNFEDKGGATLLKAWPMVIAARPDAQLVIAGSPQPATLPPPQSHIEWLPYVPREQLLNELIPSFDVFTYPTEYDYMPYILPEVMGRGIPIAISNYRNMDFMVGEQGGLVSPCGDARALADNILRLLEPETNARFRRGARERFEIRFSREAVLPLLSECYSKAIHSTPE